MFGKKIQANKAKGLVNLVVIGAIAFPSVTISFFIAPTKAIAQSTNKAVVFDPPSNVRAYPNGQIICSVRSATSINVYGYNNGWYRTDYCGQGYIHQSQVQLQQQTQAKHSSSFCDVINISQGQLALRFTPNGESRAGLNNGNTVRPLQQQGMWSYVQVFNGPSSQVNGLKGWVNSNYLTCYDLNRVSNQQPTLTSSSATESPVTRKQTANTNTSQAWQDAKLVHALEERFTNGNLIPINSVAFAPNSKTLVTGAYDGKTKLWDLSTGELKGQKKFSAFDTEDDGRRVYSINTVAINPDGKFLISSSTSAIEAVNLNTGDTHYLIQKVGSSFIITPDGQTLISANADGSVKLSNIRSGELQRSLPGKVQGSTALSVSKDGSLIAAGSMFGKIQVWDGRRGELKREFENNGLDAQATAISPDNKYLFTSFSNPSLVQMWNIRTGKVIRNLSGHSDVVTSIAISPDGQTLATGSEDGTIRIMDLRTRELIRVLKDAGKIQSVSFSPDSRTIASSSEDGKIMVWQKP